VGGVLGDGGERVQAADLGWGEIRHGIGLSR
jgi:hypothetical protein